MRSAADRGSLYPDPELIELLGELDGGDELVAHVTTMMWIRILYPDASLPLNLPQQAQILSGWATSINA